MKRNIVQEKEETEDIVNDIKDLISQLNDVYTITKEEGEALLQQLLKRQEDLDTKRKDLEISGKIYEGWVDINYNTNNKNKEKAVVKVLGSNLSEKKAEEFKSADHNINNNVNEEMMGRDNHIKEETVVEVGEAALWYNSACLIT